MKNCVKIKAVHLQITHISVVKSRVGISGTTAKSGKCKFVPSSHSGPFALVASSRKCLTNVGTVACFDFL